MHQLSGLHKADDGMINWAKKPTQVQKKKTSSALAPHLAEVYTMSAVPPVVQDKPSSFHTFFGALSGLSTVLMANAMSQNPLLRSTLSKLVIVQY